MTGSGSILLQSMIGQNTIACAFGSSRAWNKSWYSKGCGTSSKKRASVRLCNGVCVSAGSAAYQPRRCKVGDSVQTVSYRFLMSVITAWCEIIQTSMHQLAHPAMITLCSISSASSVLSKWPQRPWSEAPPPHPSGLGLSATTNVYHAEGQASASISHSPYPSAIYGQQSETLTGVPSRPEKLYYSLASSSIYFKPLATCNKSMPPYTLQPLASYQINLLATATHPLSTYNRQLANHMVDLAQSYVDLYVLGRERWALTGDPSDSNSEQYLPWHLRAVSYMPGYDINALLPP